MMIVVINGFNRIRRGLPRGPTCPGRATGCVMAAGAPECLGLKPSTLCVRG